MAWLILSLGGIGMFILGGMTYFLFNSQNEQVEATSPINANEQEGEQLNFLQESGGLEHQESERFEDEHFSEDEIGLEEQNWQYEDHMNEQLQSELDQFQEDLQLKMLEDDFDYDWNNPYIHVGTDINIDIHYHGVVDDPLDSFNDSFNDDFDRF